MKDKIRSLDQALMSPAQKRHFLAALRHPTVNASYIADVCCHQDVLIPWSDILSSVQEIEQRCHVRLSEPGTSGFYSGAATESSVSVKVIRVAWNSEHPTGAGGVKRYPVGPVEPEE